MHVNSKHRSFLGILLKLEQKLKITPNVFERLSAGRGGQDTLFETCTQTYESKQQTPTLNTLLVADKKILTMQ
jgi:hypothetical protein